MAKTKNNKKIQKDNEITIPPIVEPKRDSKKKKKEKKPNWFKRHKKTTIVLCFFITLLFAASAAFIIAKLNKPEETITKPSKPAAIHYYSALSGREVDSKDEIHAATTCVMIENSTAARPQSGLEDAGVVYEAIAEGGISRFLTIFQDRKPNLVGPVRSVRLHFAQWGTPYHCTFAHVGGADDALQLVRSSNDIRDADQFFNDSYYWRSKNRHAPHNMYTSFEKLDQFNQSKNYTSSQFEGFARKTSKIKKVQKQLKKCAELQKKATQDSTQSSKVNEKCTNLASVININLSSSVFNPNYQYNSQDNTYYRSYQNGEKHLTVNKEGQESQLHPDVVIAIAVGAVNRPGTEYDNFVTTGEGKAHIFQNGTVKEATWVRQSANDELSFKDAKGKTIKLNRGQTWITAYPANVGNVQYQ